MEKNNKVHIFCSDGTSYEGDILIGADGAYSGVRQSLYKWMDEKGVLPPTDLENFSIGFVSMVGVAEPKDPEKYPQLKDPFSNFSVVVGEHGRNVSCSSREGGAQSLHMGCAKWEMNWAANKDLC